MSLRLAISVEGQTEERFVKVILAPHLLQSGIVATPIIIQTGRSANGLKRKGGGVSFRAVSDDFRRLLLGYRDGFVTSLYDFYGFVDRQPGETEAQLERRLWDAAGGPVNLLPYVQKYEFETLLLADAETAAGYFQAPKLALALQRAVEGAGGAECVNDGEATAPSKRFESWTRDYAPPLMRFTRDTKVRHGAALAEKLTLPTIRAACPRFNDWLSHLETLRK